MKRILARAALGVTLATLIAAIGVAVLLRPSRQRAVIHNG